MRPSNPWTVRLMLLAVGVMGCAPDAQEPADFAVRDSAGVRIVVRETAAWKPSQEWRITPAPRVRIGQVEGPEASTLHRVAGAIRQSDGRIAVGNGGSQDVRIYDGTGQWLARCRGPVRTISCP